MLSTRLLNLCPPQHRPDTLDTGNESSVFSTVIGVAETSAPAPTSASAPTPAAPAPDPARPRPPEATAPT